MPLSLVTKTCATFVFTRDDPEDAFSTWSVEHQFTGTFANAIVNLNPEPSGWIAFGINVAIDGDELIVGASSRDVVAPVQVFSKTPSGFTLGRSARVVAFSTRASWTR